MGKPQEITLRRGGPQDTKELHQLFVDTITTVCRSDYNEEQIRAWSASVEDKNRWMQILNEQLVLVAVLEQKIVGFVTLDDGNYIDLMYVHKDYQRKGLAHRLYEAIEKEAVQKGHTFVTANVSITARPFFEREGFVVTKEQKVIRQNVELTNFRMRKKLDGVNTKKVPR